VSKALLESVNATKTLPSQMLLEEFVTGFPLENDNLTTEKEAILGDLFHSLKLQFPKIDSYPFLMFSSQNCSDMIVAIGTHNC
jgi:hypothetical protein